MSYRDGSPCDSNDGAPLMLNLTEGIEIIPCSTTTTTSATASTTTTTEIIPTKASVPTTESLLEKNEAAVAVSTTSTDIVVASTTTDSLSSTAATTTGTTEVSKRASDEETDGDSSFIQQPATTTVASATTTTQTSTTTLATVSSDKSSSGEASAETFYSCDTKNYIIETTVDAFQLDIVYDYEVHWSADAEASANRMSMLENRIVKDLADHFGLTSCQARARVKQRRNLRKDDRANAVLALGADPEDKSIDDLCK